MEPQQRDDDVASQHYHHHDDGDDDGSSTTIPHHSHGKITKATKVSKSCDHCKLKKIKCCQTRPVCANCIKFGEPCNYSVMKKPGLKTGYGQQVMEQITQLTTMFESTKQQQLLETERLKDMVNSLEMKLISMENPRHDGEAIGSKDGGKEGSNHDNSVSNSLDMNFINNDGPATTDINHDMPSVDKCITLVDSYFKYLNPISPMVHPRQQSQILSDISPNNVMLLGILINTLQFENQGQYFDSLKHLIITKCYGVKTIDELIAITLLGITLYGELNNNDTWSIVSIAVGGVIHLGLAEPSTSDDDWSSWVDLETIRNVVWEVYKLDKLSSMGSHFNGQLSTPKILLPLDSQYWYSFSSGYQHQTRTLDHRPLSNWYGTNSLIIEVLQLMDECLSFRKIPLDIHDVKDLLVWQLQCYEFDHKIQDWKNQLNPTIAQFLDAEVFESQDANSILLHALYHTLIIRLHSPAAFSNSLEKYVSSQTSRSKCLKSAQKVLNLSKLPRLELGPYYAFAIWVSGRVLLVDHISNRGELSPDFEYSITLLRSMNYTSASKFADILEFFKDDKVIDSPEVSDHPSTGSYSEEARLIIDLKLNASSLDSLLSKKVERVKNKGFDDDVFDWFKLPLERI